MAGMATYVLFTVYTHTHTNDDDDDEDDNDDDDDTLIFNNIEGIKNTPRPSFPKLKIHKIP